jgi:L-lactate dehydrogenase complex protein LldG
MGEAQREPEPKGAKIMSNARIEIFASIRRALGVTGEEAPRRQSVDDRLDHAPKGIVPMRGQGDPLARKEIFKTQALRAQASLAEVASLTAVPAEVAAYLRDNNLAAKIRGGLDSRLASMSWTETEFIVEQAKEGSDLTSIGIAFGGIAETGTLAMVSGKDNPTHLNFLPDRHIAVLQASDIVSDYERLLRKLRTVYGKGLMPRTVNFITGPSRSADIAHTLLLGAHGPRRLHIIVVNDV